MAKGYYTKIKNAFLRDKELSAKARGVLATLLVLPEKWDFSIKGLSTLFPDGVESIRKALIELESKGYLKRIQIRESGMFKGWKYEFTGEPCFDLPNTEKSNSVKPMTDNSISRLPNTENQPQLNNRLININKELNIKEIKEKKENLISSSKCTEFDVIIDTFEDEKIQEALREFIKMRFTSKKGLTTASFQMLTDQLKKMTSDSNEQIDIINNSVMNGWNVFYSLDKNPNSLKVIRPTNDDDVQIEYEDVSDEELLELQRSLRGDA